MNKNFLGQTVQLYTTSLCEMNCPHCSSKLQQMPDMTLETFQLVVDYLERFGVQRIELFANDPLLHPDIEKQIAAMNKSNLHYAILTVGSSPTNASVEQSFIRVAEKIDSQKGGFVFSVDYTEDTAIEILGGLPGAYNAYAFKANTFWQLVPFLKEKGIPSRINIVISRYNVKEVLPIMVRAAEMGFLVSFCFVQNRQAEFDEIASNGLTTVLEQNFRRFLHTSGILRDFEIQRVIIETQKILASGVLKEKTNPFNRFRGNDRKEGEIDANVLANLRHDILVLKRKPDIGSRILPSEEFICELGNRGFGCLRLLRQNRYPQIKIDSKGKMRFCCDLDDPLTSRFSIAEVWEHPGEFLKMIRTNPYVWICLFFNPCDFSINRVVYSLALRKE